MMSKENVGMARFHRGIMQAMEGKSDFLRFNKKQTIYCEGSTPLGVYFVQRGKVKISKMGSDGKQKIMRIAAAGEMISYTDLLSQSRYSTSAVAIEDTDLLFVGRNEFKNVIHEQEEVFDQFLFLLSGDLRDAQDNITNLAYKPVRGRLADALIELNDKFEQQIGKNLGILISRADLAGYVGTAKETANRFLSEFRKEGLVSTNGTRINILNLDGLKRISHLYD